MMDAKPTSPAPAAAGQSSLTALLDQLQEMVLRMDQPLDAESKSRLRTMVQAAVAMGHYQEARLAKLNQSFNVAEVLLLALDPLGHISKINAEGCRLLGYKEEELLGQNWFDLCLCEEDRPRIKGLFEDLMTGKPVDVSRHENNVLTRDGQLVPIGWHNIVLRDDKGIPTATLSSGRDLSALRRTESALTESEHRFRAIFNNTVDAIITMDEQARITSLNTSAENMFGYKAAELLGRNINILMPPPYHDEHDDYVRRYMETGHKRIIGIGREVLGLHKDGTIFPIDLAVSEVLLQNRRVFTGVIRDISERKKLEREVLEVSTRERERIGRDLHDGLGQELTGIAFLAGVLKRELAGKQRPEAENAGEIVRLTNTAIDHTRALVKGLCPVTIEPDGLMNSLRGLADMICEVHGLQCEFDCPRPVWIPNHNVSTHLYYIAQEAVNNAIKHAKATQITIGLYGGRKMDALRITDNGQGINPKIDEAAGRGMHIMKYRAKMIDASLEVISQPKRGTIIACSFEHQS